MVSREKNRTVSDANRFADQFITESISVLTAIDTSKVERCAEGLAGIRDAGGRLFILGVGGSAGHASHAVNDFRKICGLEAYTPTDNVSELTARTNDDGWDTTFESWLKVSRLGPNDAVLVFSVGGGDVERQVSVNLVRALELARARGSKIFGIVGRTGGFTAEVADECVVIPPLFEDHITPHTEGLCAVIWHLMVSHPLLAISKTKWESVT
jgi:D-sedoheptulose 7-phosphate isomerase